MNVGLQDAMNLGRKLAAEIRGEALSLLDTYQDERVPIGEELAHYTLAQGALITATSVSGQALRGFLSEQLAINTELNLHLACKLSGLDVTYPSSDQVSGLRAYYLLPLADHGQLSDALTRGRAVHVDLTGEAKTPVSSDNALIANVSLAANDQARRLGVKSFVVRPDGHILSAIPGAHPRSAHSGVAQPATS